MLGIDQIQPDRTPRQGTVNRTRSENNPVTPLAGTTSSTFVSASPSQLQSPLLPTGQDNLSQLNGNSRFTTEVVNEDIHGLFPPGPQLSAASTIDDIATHPSPKHSEGKIGFGKQLKGFFKVAAHTAASVARNTITAPTKALVATVSVIETLSSPLQHATGIAQKSSEKTDQKALSIDVKVSDSELNQLLAKSLEFKTPVGEISDVKVTTTNGQLTLGATLGKSKQGGIEFEIPLKINTGGNSARLDLQLGGLKIKDNSQLSQVLSGLGKVASAAGQAVEYRLFGTSTNGAIAEGAKSAANSLVSLATNLVQSYQNPNIEGQSLDYTVGQAVNQTILQGFQSLFSSDGIQHNRGDAFSAGKEDVTVSNSNSGPVLSVNVERLLRKSLESSGFQVSSGDNGLSIKNEEYKSYGNLQNIRIDVEDGGLNIHAEAFASVKADDKSVHQVSNILNRNFNIGVNAVGNTISGLGKSRAHKDTDGTEKAGKTDTTKKEFRPVTMDASLNLKTLGNVLKTHGSYKGIKIKDPVIKEKNGNLVLSANINIGSNATKIAIDSKIRLTPTNEGKSLKIDLPQVPLKNLLNAASAAGSLGNDASKILKEKSLSFDIPLTDLTQSLKLDIPLHLQPKIDDISFGDNKELTIKVGAYLQTDNKATQQDVPVRRGKYDKAPATIQQAFNKFIDE